MKVLAVLSRFPYPLTKGDRLRAYHFLRILSQYHEIHLICTTDEPVRPDDLAAVQQYCTSLQVYKLSWWGRIINLLTALPTWLPFQAAYFRSREAKAAVSVFCSEQQPDIVWCQLVRSVPNLPDTQVRTRHWSLDYMDSMSMNMQRRAENSYGISRWLAQIEAARLRRYEAHVANRFDSLSIITDLDKSYFPAALAQRILTIPNGIALPSKSTENDAPIVPSGSHEYDIIFTGNLGYFPNATAARLLIEHIMPQVWAKRPDTRVALVGAEPGPDIRKLASERVIVTGFVPSMTAELLKSRIFVAPLFAGSGLQNKLLEAMSVGLPVVCSPLPAQSLGVNHQAECIVANTPEGFAQAIIQLLDAPELGFRLGRAGQNYVRQHFDWEQALQPLFATWKHGSPFNSIQTNEPTAKQDN